MATAVLENGVHLNGSTSVKGHRTTFTVNATGRARLVTHEGRDYLVAPMVLIDCRRGVLPGSKGPLLYTPEDTKAAVNSWNGVALTKYHPQDPLTAEHLSASDPGVWERQGLGRVKNARFDKMDRLCAEGWFDSKRTQRLAPEIYNALKNGRPFDLSTGLYTHNEPAPDGSTFNGLQYTAYARNHTPDHVAALFDQVGACTLPDCGVLVNQKNGKGKPTVLRDGPGTIIFNEWSDAARQAAAAARKAGSEHTPDAVHQASKEAGFFSKQAGEGKGTHAAAANMHLEASRLHRMAGDTAGSYGDHKEAEGHEIAARAHDRAASEHLKEHGASAGEALKAQYARNAKDAKGHGSDSHDGSSFRPIKGRNEPDEDAAEARRAEMSPQQKLARLNKLNISEVHGLLQQKGYGLGKGSVNLEKKETSYEVKHPDGTFKKMTTGEIGDLLHKIHGVHNRRQCSCGGTCAGCQARNRLTRNGKDDCPKPGGT